MPVRDSYCELMGVEGPENLPAKRDGKRIEVRGIITCSMQVPVEGYKGGNELGERFANPTMPRSLSHSDFSACAVYAQHLRDGQADLRSPPNGPPPPGYEDYIIMMATQSGAIDVPDKPSTKSPGHQGGDPYATVSMPPEAFNHLMNSHVRTAELVGGYRSGNRYDRPKPYTPTYESRGRGRGTYRGRGGTRPIEFDVRVISSEGIT